MMNKFIVTTKTATKFFSEKTYMNNNNTLDYEFVIERFALSKSLAMFNHFNIQKITNIFSGYLLYND